MKRILTKETIFIVLFLISACLIMLSVFYYDMHTELSIKQAKSIDEIKKEYRIITMKFESMAKILYSHLDSMKDIKEMFYRSSIEKNLVKKQLLREKFKNAVTPFYNEIKRYEFYDLKFHFKDGTNFIRMSQNEKFGNNVNYRRSIVESNTNNKYFSGLEHGRFNSSYRYIFPIFLNGDHIGAIEFTVSLQTITENLSSLYGNSYQIILKKSEYDINDNTNWCHSKNFHIQGSSNRDVEDIIKNCEQSANVLEKMNIFNSFTNQLINKGKEYFAGFLSIANSEGKKSGYLIKVEENNDTSEIYDTFLFNSLINVLISTMLIILILSYNNIHGRIKEMKMFDAMVVTANHEIKQPLAIITSYLELILNNEELDKNTKSKLQKISTNADKINHILEKLRQIKEPSYVDYANFTKMIDIEKKNKSSIES